MRTLPGGQARKGEDLTFEAPNAKDLEALKSGDRVIVE